MCRDAGDGDGKGAGKGGKGRGKGRGRGAQPVPVALPDAVPGVVVMREPVNLEFMRYVASTQAINKQILKLSRNNKLIN